MLVAGCGSSDSRPAGSEYVRQVDRLCREANPQLAEINSQLVRARDAARAGIAKPTATFASFERLLNRAGGVTRRLEAELRKVRPPAGEAEFHRKLLRSVGEGSANVRRQVSAARAGDARRLSELSVQGSTLNARSKGLVAGHGGFRHCGRG